MTFANFVKNLRNILFGPMDFCVYAVIKWSDTL